MTTTNCKISIIIPVYNSEKYLEKCLDSLINQTLKDIEIICTNDGSTDNSLNILKKYSEKDSRIKILECKNEGPSAARNMGLEIATGNYIGFVDADDWIELDYFEKLYKSAIDNGADIVCADIIKVYENKSKCFVKNKRNKTVSRIEDKIEITKMRTHNYIWNKIYKKDLFTKNNLKFKKGMYFEDMVFTPQAIFYSNKLSVIKNAKYFYRHNPMSIVNILSDKKIKDYKAAVALMKKFAIEKGFELPPNLTMKNWKKYKLFGFIQILKVKEWDYKKEFYLFGVIPFLRVTKNDYEG